MILLRKLLKEYFQYLSLMSLLNNVQDISFVVDIFQDLLHVRLIHLWKYLLHVKLKTYKFYSLLLMFRDPLFQKIETNLDTYFNYLIHTFRHHLIFKTQI